MLKEAQRADGWAFGLTYFRLNTWLKGAENVALILASNPSEPVPLQTDANGTIRVGNTRVTLDLVIAAFLDGASAEEIAQTFDTLDLGDVYSVLGYYIHHKDTTRTT